MTFFWFPVFFYCGLIHQQLSESLSISATHFWKLVKFNSKKKLVTIDVQNPGVGFIRNFPDAAARGKDAHQSVELCMVLSLLFNRILQGDHSHFLPIWASSDIIILHYGDNFIAETWFEIFLDSSKWYH